MILALEVKILSDQCRGSPTGITTIKAAVVVVILSNWFNYYQILIVQ